MAFSTQREFFQPELNQHESLSKDTLQRTVLKTYGSCTDSRGWAISANKRTGYILDLLKTRENRNSENHVETREEIFGSKLGHQYNKLQQDKDNTETNSTSLSFNHTIDGQQSKSLKTNSKTKKSKSSSHGTPNGMDQVENEIKRLKYEGIYTQEAEIALLRKELRRTLEYKENFETLLKENMDLKNEITKMKDHDSLIGRTYSKTSQQTGTVEKATVGDDTNVQDIIEERDRLREQLNRLLSADEKIDVLKKRAREAEKLEAERDNLKLWFTELTKMYTELKERSNIQVPIDAHDVNASESSRGQNEIGRLTKKLKDYENIKKELELYKAHYGQLFSELNKFRHQLECAASSQEELFETKRQLCQAENAIIEYEVQLEQLVICMRELSKNVHVMQEMYDTVKNLTILCLVCACLIYNNYKLIDQNPSLRLEFKPEN